MVACLPARRGHRRRRGCAHRVRRCVPIRARLGGQGIADMVVHDGRLGAITDDTQMTLFTAEAMLGYLRRGSSYDTASLKHALYFSYQRWLATQGERPVGLSHREVELRGLLWDCPELHHRRGTGTTCSSRRGR